MTRAERRCPVHSEPEADQLDAWPCPDDCQHLLVELERRIDDIRVGGNFTRLYTDEHGRRMVQRFQDHQPVGEPMPWRSLTRDR